MHFVFILLVRKQMKHSNFNYSKHDKCGNDEESYYSKIISKLVFCGLDKLKGSIFFVEEILSSINRFCSYRQSKMLYFQCETLILLYSCLVVRFD